MNLKSFWMAAALAGVTYGASADVVMLERVSDRMAQANYGEWALDACTQLQNPVMFEDTLVQLEAKVGWMSSQNTMNLELVPTSAHSNTLILMFKEQPLSNVEVTVFGPPKWQQSFLTDEQGRIDIETPRPGQYVVEATHREDQAGAFAGQSYRNIRYVSTLTFEKAA